MLDELGDKISDTVAINSANVDENQKEIVKYFVVQILGEISKLVLMIAIAYLLGVGKLFLICFLAMSAYRCVGGGFHCKGHVSCFIISFIFFFGNIYASLYIKNAYLDYIYLVMMIFNIIVISLYAPADTEMKPIVSKKLRRNLKVISYIAMLGTMAVGRFLITDLTIRNMCIYGTFIQSITMLPFAYRLSGTKYGFRDGIFEPQI